jgi:rhamnose transport system substrate-binding protein
MAEYVKNGCCEEFALWNPVDLGYLTAYVAHRMLAGEITGKAGETFEAGRLGEYTIQVDGDDVYIVLGPPFRFNAENIDEWAKVY